VALEEFLSAQEISGWLRRIFFDSPAHRFAWASLLLLITLAIAPTKDFFKEWRHYQRQYVKFISTRPDGAALQRHFTGGIQQVWLPELGVVDRCTTCHLAVTETSLQSAAAVPAPFRPHPPVGHNVKEWGCVVCHRGQGPATEVAEAHNTTRARQQPLLPVKFIQASCGSCHHDELREAPQLTRGRQLLAELNCQACHLLPGIARPAMLGPDLTNIGTKVSREWIYKWLKEPRTILDKDGNATVNGYETQEEPRMPQFRLAETELRGLSAYLSVQKAKAISPYKIDARVIATWSKNPELISQGEARFRQMFCSTCHPLAVTRAGETKLIGGDIGPELTKVGSKVNADWLLTWLRDPQGYLPHTRMPRYGWSDEDLYKVTQYLTTKLTDSALLSGVPQLGRPTDQEIQLGHRLFLEKGCATCHSIDGLNPQKDFGPDLSAIGGKNASELDFGTAKIPHNLVAYVQAKLQDPTSVNPAARMPQYNWNPSDLDAITTALLSMKGPPATSALRNLVVPRKEVGFHPAGSFGEVYERYKCDACHKFNGYGSDLAPDLTYEGSRAQRPWLVDFLKNPQTLRPTLVLRMPQFNMSDKDAQTLADYMTMVLQHPAANPAAVDAKQFTPAMIVLGKQLYEGKYQCQSCHTIGGAGGYVGPNLNNAGGWLTPAWIEAWLRNPQALIPDTIEPRRDFSEEEVKALTAYLMTLRQNIKPQKTASTTATHAPTQGAGR
jgi:mono/diheme cytochrome c family protein